MPLLKSLLGSLSLVVAASLLGTTLSFAEETLTDPQLQAFCTEHHQRCDEVRAKIREACAENPQRCEARKHQLENRLNKLREQCQANPSACEQRKQQLQQRASQARERCNANPEACRARSDEMKQRRQARQSAQTGS
jgi:hypothetical protein